MAGVGCKAERRGYFLSVSVRIRSGYPVLSAMGCRCLLFSPQRRKEREESRRVNKISTGDFQHFTLFVFAALVSSRFKKNTDDGETLQPACFHFLGHENEKPSEYPVRSTEGHLIVGPKSSKKSCLNGFRCIRFTQQTGRARITAPVIPARRSAVPGSHLFGYVPESGRFRSSPAGKPERRFGGRHVLLSCGLIAETTVLS